MSKPPPLKIIPFPKPGDHPAQGVYINYLGASYAHAVQMIVRRRRMLLAAVITLIPAIIPLAIGFFSKSEFNEDGNRTFIYLVELVHIDSLGPLLALFFASLLVGEEIETQTISYILTRPIPRSAWVLGRFFAYMTVASIMISLSIFLTFSACAPLSGIGFTAVDFKLMAHYCGVATMGLMGYGAVAIFLGAYTKRPIIIGVILLYGWQQLAMMVPGVIDFLTIKKYTDAILPVLATQRHNISVQSALGEYQKEFYLISAGNGALILIAITIVLLGITILLVRNHQKLIARAVGQ